MLNLAESTWGSHEMVTELEVPDTCGLGGSSLCQSHRYHINFAGWQTKKWGTSVGQNFHGGTPNSTTFLWLFTFDLGTFKISSHHI